MHEGGVAPVLTLVVATGNRHKLIEIRAILRGLPLEVLGVSEVLAPPHVEEDGDTFVANAQKKARTIATASRHLTLADDSGLEVDALGGRPGIRSARYAGERASDADNCAHLLGELREVGELGRAARFRCALVLVDPWGVAGSNEHVVEGTCEGRIAMAPSGSCGFGYDPLFVVAGAGDGGAPCTMAELSDEAKNAISHRGQALAALRPILESLVLARLATSREALQLGRTV